MEFTKRELCILEAFLEEGIITVVDEQDMMREDGGFSECTSLAVELMLTEAHALLEKIRMQTGRV